MVKVEKNEGNSEMNANGRQIVVPGETIVSGEHFLPSEGAYRDGEDIVAGRFGLADISDKFVRVIPVSGVYQARRGNSIIATVVDVTFNGWLLDFGGAQNAFLSINEVPKFINKNELREHFDFGDSVACKVWDVKARGIDVSIKMRGYGKIEGGMIVTVNPNKVPRVIGKEGSMVNLIKDATGCNITVGQNGKVWISGNSIDDEIKTKKIVEFICDNSTTHGLTEKVEAFIKKLK